MKRQQYDTIIVGGGIAGLTSAAYLARSGQKILLIEKNNEFGGLVSSFNKDGFHFEGGVRALESAGIILPMLTDLGIKLNTFRSKVSIGIENEILYIENLNSISEYENLLIKLFPDSKNEIIDFIVIMRKVMKHLDVLYGIENPVFKDLKKDKIFLFKKLLPWLPKFLFTLRKINKLNMPIEIYLRKIITNQSLRDVISQHFFKGTPAFFALSYFSLYLDYFYPEGGVGKLAEKLLDKTIEFKGNIKANTSIIKVIPKDKYLIDNKNNQYSYNNLIWAADLKTLYKITSSENFNTRIRFKIEKAKQKILNHKGGESVFSLYLEIDQPLDYFRDIVNGHFFYTPSLIGLGNTHRQDLSNLLKNWERNNKPEVLLWLDKFLSLNTFEISIPGLKDANLVPKNKTGMIISFLVDYELFNKVQNSGWLEEFNTKIEDHIISIITNSVFPTLGKSVIKRFSFTPLSIKKRIGSSEGAIVGWSFEKQVPVLNKIHRSDKSVLTPIPNIFVAGQWAYSPAGVPMSILTGKLAANKVLKQ